MESLVEVKLIGELGRRFGRSYSFVASSPREVISALSNQIEGFKDYLCGAHERGIGFRLVDGDAEGMGYEEAMMGCKQLIIAPVITGGGTIGKILLGVALVALAFVPMGGAFAGFVAAKGAFAIGSGILFSLGTSLILSGIASLLTPPVQPPRETERKDSFLFDRATELTTQGQPVPLLYGKFLAASPLIISSAITTQQVPV
jgi:predicted phage tail protein